jgi:hypothetical protein
VERRPQPAKRAATRSIPAPARELHARRPAGPDGTVALNLADDGLDPDLRAYLRAPYDPLNAAQATRFVVRGLLRQPFEYGWMRHFALVVALVLVGTLIASLVGLGGLIVSGSAEEALIFGLQVLLVTGPMGAFGVVLLWRLVRY